MWIMHMILGCMVGKIKAPIWFRLQVSSVFYPVVMVLFHRIVPYGWNILEIALLLHSKYVLLCLIYSISRRKFISRA